MSPLGLRTIGRLVPGLGRLRSQPAPKNHYMIFVDSENLVSQFQSMKADGRTPLQNDNIFYKPNLYLWTPMPFPSIAQVNLARFYLLFTGGENKRNEIINEIGSFPVSANIQGENKFSPILIEGKKGKANGIVEQISLDISQSSAPNPMTVCLFAGSSDYLPVLQEAKQQGKQIQLFAFSKGLSLELKETANEFHPVDEFFFERILV